MKRFLFAASLAMLMLLGGCSTTRQEQTPFEILKQSVVDRQGNKMEIDSDYLLMYYAADWCPYCVAYADQLKQTYEQYKQLFGNRIEIIFAGHKDDQSNQALLAFLDQGNYPFGYIRFEDRERTNVMGLLGPDRFYIPGFLLLDRDGNILSSSNGETKDDYVRDRPLHHLQSLLMQDCASCQK